MPQFDLTPEEAEGLRIAHEMVDAGIPVFAAPPCPDDCKTAGHQRQEFHLPRAWQKITPSHKQIERWRPGWGLAAIGGHAADVLDDDPRAGGDKSVAELKAGGIWPRVFGVVRTKSDGFHYYISPLRERETNGFMPGLDYQGGDTDGEGRAFAWLPPTRARSKADGSLGEIRPYEWVSPPDLDGLKEWSGDDDSGENLRELVSRRRESLGVSKPKENAPEVAPAKPDDPFVRSSQIGTGGSGYSGKTREFTQGAAESFCLPSLMTLRDAKIGEIEEKANRAAITLSHFVPEFWTPEQAYAILVDNLSHTAYDPTHPASSWTAEKFRPVLDGSRPARDPWRAMKLSDAVPDSLAAPVAESESDAVDALLAEMLTFDQIIERPAPEHLIDGLLLLDSEAWMIGAPGSKKSFVLLDMGAHIALGKPWRGRPVVQGTVVIIAAEGAGGLTHRAKAWMLKHGMNPEHVLKVLPRPVQAADKRAWSVLVEACRRLAPVMVAVDTQARSTVGLEENSATDMGHYVEAVSAIRQATGACVLSIHHTGRAGGDARGSSAIDGAQYTELKVECEAGKMSGRLVTEKQKDIEQADPIPLKFEKVQVGIDKHGKPITSLVLVEMDEYESASTVEEGPEPWETQHGDAQVRLIKVLRDQGGTIGLTKAEARQSVIERFYGGDQKALKRSTWATAWTKVLEKTTAAGDPLVVNVRGEKHIVDPLALETFAAEAAARGD